MAITIRKVWGVLLLNCIFGVHAEPGCCQSKVAEDNLQSLNEPSQANPRTHLETPPSDTKPSYLTPDDRALSPDHPESGRPAHPQSRQRSEDPWQSAVSRIGDQPGSSRAHAELLADGPEPLFARRVDVPVMRVKGDSRSDGRAEPRDDKQRAPSDSASVLDGGKRQLRQTAFLPARFGNAAPQLRSLSTNLNEAPVSALESHRALQRGSSLPARHDYTSPKNQRFLGLLGRERYLRKRTRMREAESGLPRDVRGRIAQYREALEARDTAVRLMRPTLLAIDDYFEALGLTLQLQLAMRSSFLFQNRVVFEKQRKLMREQAQTTISLDRILSERFNPLGQAIFTLRHQIQAGVRVARDEATLADFTNVQKKLHLVQCRGSTNLKSLINVGLGLPFELEEPHEAEVRQPDYWSWEVVRRKVHPSQTLRGGRILLGYTQLHGIAPIFVPRGQQPPSPWVGRFRDEGLQRARDVHPH